MKLIEIFMIDTIHGLFRERVKRVPDAPALTDGVRSYSYAELDTLTDGLAARLLAQGVEVESVIGCWLGDPFATVVAILGILKAGGAYLLLDRQLPADRLRYMVEDADIWGFVADATPPPSLVQGIPVVLMQDIKPSRTTLHPQVDRNNLAYIAYTSGSTGRPKGVMITHGATVNHARAFDRIFRLKPSDRAPIMAPAGFDMATEEMIPPLLAGCTLVSTALATDSMAQFTADIIARRYTFLNLPAPLWQEWTMYLHGTSTAVPPDVRFVIAGSDKIYTSTYQLWQELTGADKVWWVAAYGVTEATVTSTLYTTAATDDLSSLKFMPIGTPIDYVTVQVMNDEGRPVASGEAGELYIGGAGLARGYCNLPDKTAQSFITGRDGQRYYRTGDLVRQLPNGALLWLGRMDAQIKINGLRIEPAEVEAVIHDFPSVDEVIVVATQPDPQTCRLIAFVAPRHGQTVNETAVLSFAKSRLHPLMVPARVMALAAIPLNQNGKIDRKALEHRAVNV
jgi:amino acid adenylation domain-containing protein